jgi:hypothetical protein
MAIGSKAGVLCDETSVSPNWYDPYPFQNLDVELDAVLAAVVNRMSIVLFGVQPAASRLYGAPCSPR